MSTKNDDILEKFAKKKKDKEILSKIKAREQSDRKKSSYIYTFEEALDKMPLLGIFSNCTEKDEIALARKKVRVIVDEGVGSNIKGKESVSFSMIDSESDFNYTFDIPYRSPVVINYNLLEYLSSARDFGFDKYNQGIVDNRFDPVKTKKVYQIEVVDLVDEGL